MLIVFRALSILAGGDPEPATTSAKRESIERSPEISRIGSSPEVLAGNLEDSGLRMSGVDQDPAAECQSFGLETNTGSRNLDLEVVEHSSSSLFERQVGIELQTESGSAETRTRHHTAAHFQRASPTGIGDVGQPEAAADGAQEFDALDEVRLAGPVPAEQDGERGGKIEVGALEVLEVAQVVHGGFPSSIAFFAWPGRGGRATGPWFGQGARATAGRAFRAGAGREHPLR